MNEIDYPVPPAKDDERFRFLFDYWRARCGDGRLPARHHIDVLDLKSLLGHLNIIKVDEEDGRRRYVYKLWATRVTRMYGRDYTGRELGELELGIPVETVRRVLDEVVATRQPHFWEMPLPRNDDGFVAYRRLLLPLAADGLKVDHMLALLIGVRPS